MWITKPLTRSSSSRGILLLDLKICYMSFIAPRSFWRLIWGADTIKSESMKEMGRRPASRLKEDCMSGWLFFLVYLMPHLYSWGQRTMYPNLSLGTLLWFTLMVLWSIARENKNIWNIFLKSGSSLKTKSSMSTWRSVPFSLVMLYY